MRVGIASVPTLSGGTYPYSIYKGVSPPPGGGDVDHVPVLGDLQGYLSLFEFLAPGLCTVMPVWLACEGRNR